jgi:hypothetical protein
MSNDTIFKIPNYYEDVIPQQNLSTFKSHFRMTCTQFEVILNNIGHSQLFVKKSEEQFGGRKQICPEKALLITLWTLATPDCYRSVGERFNVSKSSVYNTIRLVVQIILTELCPKFIKWPDQNEKAEIAINFNQYGLQNVLGVIDGCHIPIRRPSENGIDYFNRKKFYSLVLQAICTSDLLFIDCDVRWPGSVHDSRVLRTSNFYQVAPDLCGVDYYIIGDAAYPSKTWLMTPFRNNGHLTPPQVFYNTQLSKTRVKIENTFALLKGRFRRLKDELVRYHIEDYVKTIVACCVLHNICIIEDDNDLQEYIHEGRDERHIPMVLENYELEENKGFIRRNEVVADLWNRHMNQEI